MTVPASESSPGAALHALLSDIQQMLKEEQELFGDSLLAEKPLEQTGGTVAPKKDIPGDEPLLFDLPELRREPLTGEPWGQALTMEALNAQICTCMKCALGSTRTNFVFGVGNPHATLILIGEAPGADEDAQGEPFVGRAGQLLTKILAAINFRREDVYICNILKCRPPGNREPLADEVDHCLPYLKKQIELISPKLIVCLGLTAVKNLLHTTESLSTLRGRVLRYEGIPLMVTYHPAALLRNPNWKRPTWEDVQAIRKYHDELVAQAR